MSNWLLKRQLFLISTILCFGILPLYAQGAGNALDFGGTDEYVDFGSAPELRIQDSLTIELWINIPAGPGDNVTIPTNVFALVTYGTNGETQATNQLYRLQISDVDMAGGVIDYRYQIVHESGAGTDVVTTFTTTPVFGQWVHLALNRDTTLSAYRLVVNGSVESTVFYTDNLDPDGGTSGIGVISGGFGSTGGTNVPPGGFVIGSIDEVRIWNTIVDTTTIKNWMNKKVTSSHPKYSNLAGYWRLDESTGSTASDETGNNNGTLQNMENADWITSTAPIGDASTFAESADITESVAVPIDVIFGTGAEAPGAGYSLATIQVNQAPNSTTGLLSNVPSVYWELWAEDTLFDGNFTATVRFHYDNVGGITDEINLSLYRRDDASATWSAVSATLNDEGNNADGVGYFEITITELTAGGFSGQYIVTSSDPDNPLPVQLSSFNAAIVNDGIQLEWVTESEINNLGFEVWRSTDDTDNYQMISSYANNDDLVGAGNSNSRRSYRFVDADVQEGHSYYYMLWDVSLNGLKTSHGPVHVKFDEAAALSKQFELQQNYPNPFNPATKISFTLNTIDGQNSFPTRLLITDMLGRGIRTLVNGVLPPGNYIYTWDGRDDNGKIVSSGVYVYTLQVNDSRMSRKMMFLR